MPRSPRPLLTVFAPLDIGLIRCIGADHDIHKVRTHAFPDRAVPLITGIVELTGSNRITRPRLYGQMPPVLSLARSVSDQKRYIGYVAGD